jgi:GT2 family glycosyltransferase
MLVDVVFLSNAKTVALQEMTQHAIDTCTTETDLPVNITVLEQQPVEYEGARTVHMPGEFHFNAFANHGVRMGSAKWIVVANNDLIFGKHWLEPLLAANHPVASSKCPARPSQAHITENTTGYDNGVHFSGWCFMIRRDLWEQIGEFDECVSFWCSDDVVIEQVKAVGITPMLVPASRVEHLSSVTLRQTDDPEGLLTREQLKLFNRKYRGTDY